jgi:hypothetical protein
VLAALDDPAAQETWRCVHCHEDNPGTFDVCWSCGAAVSSADRANPALSPYRGLREVTTEPAVAAATVVPPAERRRDLLWAVGAGCVPVALTIQQWDHVGAFQGLSQAGQTGALNLIVGAELLVCLWLLQRRGAGLRELWGSRPGAATDFIAALIFGGLLFLVERLVFGMFNGGEIAATPLPALATGRATQPHVMAGELFLLVSGSTLAAGAGACLLYGVVLTRLRALLGSAVGAACLTAVLGALVWSPSDGLPWFAAELAKQLLLCAGFLLVGRVWPLAVSGLVSYLAIWLLPFLRG